MTSGTPAAGFTRSIERGTDRVVVRFAGELDLAGCDACRRTIDEIEAVTDELVQALAESSGTGRSRRRERAGML